MSLDSKVDPADIVDRVAFRPPLFLKKFQSSMQDPWLYEPDAVFSAFHRRFVVGIKTYHWMPLVSGPLHSSLCALLPRQDVQPDEQH
ncbi:hypothetical protein TNCV_3921981 [Trichonephila clavipes]|nr:hypothetical protein TNCV_3921981 [Trichonephila clavipes]